MLVTTSRFRPRQVTASRSGHVAQAGLPHEKEKGKNILCQPKKAAYIKGKAITSGVSYGR
eukprot:1156212-Pelagomonas_calceolata.AAC.5